MLVPAAYKKNEGIDLETIAVALSCVILEVLQNLRCSCVGALRKDSKYACEALENFGVEGPPDVGNSGSSPDIHVCWFTCG